MTAVAPDVATTKYEDRFWTSRDGLKLHYRDYAGRGDRPPLVCMHGLTRNARDFAAFAERLSPEWRVLCPEMRGRGESEYARDASTYNPIQYVEDITALLDDAGIDRMVAIGTSLGGLMTMIMAMNAADRIAAVMINDVGPWLEPAGLKRIKDYVGHGRSFPTWVHAARALEETQGMAHPGRDLPFWIDMAKRVMVLSANGRMVFDYDMKVAEPFVGMDVEKQPDLWPGLEALSGKPALIVRGELSDLLSEATVVRMRARLPGVEIVTVPGVGHAPTLSEPEVEAAIDRFLAKVS